MPWILGEASAEGLQAEEDPLAVESRAQKEGCAEAQPAADDDAVVPQREVACAAVADGPLAPDELLPEAPAHAMPASVCSHAGVQVKYSQRLASRESPVPHLTSA